MFNSKLQKVFPLSVFLVLFALPSLGQSDVLNTPKSRNVMEFTNSEVKSKTSTENVNIIIKKLCTTLTDIKGLNEKERTTIAKSLDIYLESNDLLFVVPSFKKLLYNNFKSIESICVKYPYEMKDICIYLTNQLNTLRN